MPSAPGGNSGMRRHICKSAIAVVVVQNGSSESENQQIGKAIVVEISHRDSHAEQTLGANARLRGNVRECAISVVPVERAS